MPGFDRALVAQLQQRLAHPKPLLQVVVGARQVGKTTAARSLVESWSGPTLYAAADSALPPGPEWIETHWARGRSLPTSEHPGLLVLDEVQKIPRWSEPVKLLWDQDRAEHRPLHVVVLGSSALLRQQGLSEGLAGRFYLHRCPHWSFDECREAFGWDLEQWIYFGGYPGAAPLIDDESAWRRYISDSLIETVIARDVLAMQAVAKPTLLRHLFVLATGFPAQILSYNKMLGQLQDAGNTTTLSHYVRLLESAFLLSGLERFSAGKVRGRGSSPKLILWNNALISALGLRSFEQTRDDSTLWGRMVENAVGAHLLNQLPPLSYEVTYWRERNFEVDFIVRTAKSVYAIEVKSGRPNAPRGLDGFRKKQRGARALLLGTGGIPLEEFFARAPQDYFA